MVTELPFAALACLNAPAAASPVVAVSVSAIAAKLFSLDTVYAATGLVLFIFAAMTWRDKGNPRRVTSALFWTLLAMVFAFGSFMPHALTGVLVLLMAVLDGLGRVGRGQYEEVTKHEREAQALRFKNKIFLPVLMIPLVTFLFAGGAVLINVLTGSPFMKAHFPGFGPFNVSNSALIGLGFGGVAAMVVGLRLTRGSVRQLFDEGRRLNDAVGTVSILPQLLASLGVIFTAAKVGDLIAQAIQYLIPGQSLFLLVLANCLGMTLFTIVMGNSFAAFPVIASGVLVPLIIKPFGADPAMVAILTLTAGSSGTLMTPMAANFNIVPTALLNMRDQYGVIKFQIPFALTIWTLHVLLMWVMIKIL